MAAMNRATSRALDKAVRKDLKVLLRFTEIFCRDHRHDEHAPEQRHSVITIVERSWVDAHGLGGYSPGGRRR